MLLVLLGLVVEHGLCGVLLDFSVIWNSPSSRSPTALSILFLLSWTTVDRLGLLSSACLNPKVVFMLYLTTILLISSIYIYASGVFCCIQFSYIFSV